MIAPVLALLLVGTPAASPAPVAPLAPRGAPGTVAALQRRIDLASHATPGAVAASPRRIDLVDVSTHVPDAVLDLRYATARNFVGRPLYPAGARCLLQPRVAERLARAADALRAQGFRLRLFDCYRPLAVQRRLFEKESRPGFVADPYHGGSHHNRGGAVDLGLAGPGGEDVELPTDFDDFTVRASAHAVKGVSTVARAHRDALREAMVAAGFEPSRSEWWHFNAPEARGAPLLDVPVAP